MIKVSHRPVQNLHVDSDLVVGRFPTVGKGGDQVSLVRYLDMDHDMLTPTEIATLEAIHQVGRVRR